MWRCGCSQYFCIFYFSRSPSAPCQQWQGGKAERESGRESLIKYKYFTEESADIYYSVETGVYRVTSQEAETEDQVRGKVALRRDKRGSWEVLKGNCLSSSVPELIERQGTSGSGQSLPCQPRGLAAGAAFFCFRLGKRHRLWGQKDCSLNLAPLLSTILTLGGYCPFLNLCRL